MSHINKAKAFWNKEYTSPKHLTMSDEPSGDLVSFCNWAERNAEWPPFPQGGKFLDIGCGNGRNSIYLSEFHAQSGVGIDISGAAIEIARKKADEKGLKNLTFMTQSFDEKLPAEDESLDVVIDLMSTMSLLRPEREKLKSEVLRILKPYGWFYFKTFVLDGDSHAKRLLETDRGPEQNTYMHPRIGVPEHVWTIDEIHEFFSDKFTIHKTLKSYKHVTKEGKPHKRRTISVYMEKKRDA